MIDYSQENTCNITSDNEKGVDMAVKYLKDLNHKRIANIYGAPDTYIGHLRRTSFINAMKKYGLEISDELMFNGEYYSKENGFDAMNEIFKLDVQPTAVVCASDMLAIGAIQAIKRIGKKVPDDYSIIGFDGAEAGQLTSPLLTTVKQNTLQMGKIAAEKILEMINTKKQINNGETIIVETTILEGESTRKI